MPDPPARKWYQAVSGAVLLIIAAPFMVAGWIVAAIMGLFFVAAGIGLIWFIPEIITAIAPTVGYVVMIVIVGYAVWKGNELFFWHRTAWGSTLTLTIYCCSINSIPM